MRKDPVPTPIGMRPVIVCPGPTSSPTRPSKPKSPKSSWTRMKHFAVAVSAPELVIENLAYPCPSSTGSQPRKVPVRWAPPPDERQIRPRFRRRPRRAPRGRWPSPGRRSGCSGTAASPRPSRACRGCGLLVVRVDRAVGRRLPADGAEDLGWTTHERHPPYAAPPPPWRPCACPPSSTTRTRPWGLLANGVTRGYMVAIGQRGASVARPPELGRTYPDTLRLLAGACRTAIAFGPPPQDLRPISVQQRQPQCSL